MHTSETNEKPQQTVENAKQNEEILPGYTTIDQFTKDGYKTLMEAIRNSNSLPTGRDWNFYSAHESYAKILNEESNTVLKQMNCILRKNEIEGNIRNRVIEEKTELMIEANDVILERVANNIDEMNGIRKTVIEPVIIQTVSVQLPVNGSWNRINNATFSVSSSITSEPSKNSGNAIRLLSGKNIIRPQKFFKDKLNNSSQYPWEPRIKEKPNSLKPLAIFLEETERGHEYSHPYEYELERFSPLPEQLKKEAPKVPPTVQDTPLIEINQPEQVDELVEVLRNCKEFAVDVEHHSYRTFMGITCLVQISTREKDYLIDTLALRDKLYVLNEVFTKPSIVKIFHGADMDIQWLQRDLSLYVVNMFDTYQAAKKLGYSGLSLAYLMQRFCNFIPNKLFQLADWRIRPLPDELKAYAREDTHYLIYIYQKLKNELIDRANGQDNILLSVIKSSTDSCLKRYFKPVLRDDSHLDFYRKCKRLFDNRQLYALKELYKWRDEISREQDESTGYVLPNHMLLQISESLPREMQGILACCNPIPPLVRSNLLELHQIILRAKEQPLEKPILKEDTRARGTTLRISKVNVDSPLHCPHDISKTNEFRDDLPTLLGNRSLGNLKNLWNSNLDIECSHSVYTVFETPVNSDKECGNETIEKLRNFKFLGPFARYKLVKPFIQAEEEKLSSERNKNAEGTTETGANMEAQEDGRTDEERIESIREHFLKLARKAIPDVQEISSIPTPSQTENSKKRKREPSPPPPCLPPENLESNPNIRKDSSLKRKSSNLLEDGSPSKLAKSNDNSLSQQKGKFKNKKNRNLNQPANNEGYKKNNFNQPANKQGRKKKQNNNLNQSANERGIPQHSNSNSNFNKNKRKLNLKRAEQNSQANQYQQSEEYDWQNQDVYQSQGSSSFQNVDSNPQNNLFSIDNVGRGNNSGDRGKRGKQRMQAKRGKPKWQNYGQQPNRESQEFSPYDYSSVDFRQFQGGAGGRIQRPQEFKSNFKNRGKKKGGNRGNNNRSSPLGNFQRGGRRGQ